MAFAIDRHWIAIRVDEDEARASLFASASDDGKTATGSVPLELTKELVKELRAVLKEHAEEADRAAMGALMESIRIDQNAAPPEGVKAIKVGGGLGMSGDTARRKS